MAFESNESGRWQVHVMRLPDGGGRRQLSVDGGTAPLWSADGRHLYFVSGDRLMAVEPLGAAAAVPRQLFQHQFAALGDSYALPYVVTRDGRFVTVVQSGGEPSREIRVIFTWFEALKARVPLPRRSACLLPGSRCRSSPALRRSRWAPLHEMTLNAGTSGLWHATGEIPYDRARSMYTPAAVDAYLARIGYSGARAPTPGTLAALHRPHMQTVPFENLDIPLGRRITLAPDALWTKVIVNRRGGFCYELNTLFGRLLQALGFGVHFLSARVWSGTGWGPDKDHMAVGGGESHP